MKILKLRWKMKICKKSFYCFGVIVTIFCFETAFILPNNPIRQRNVSLLVERFQRTDPLNVLKI